MTAAPQSAEFRRTLPAASPRARLLSSFLLLCLCMLAAPCAGLAGGVRASGVSEPGLSQTQGRQQALDRALAAAVWIEARRMVIGAQPAERLEALRKELEPKSLDFVQSYQELAPVAPPEGDDAPANASAPSASAAPAAAHAPKVPVNIDLDVHLRRAALREHLLRLGFLAGDRHPGQFVLRLGKGVKEKDMPAALDAGSLLLGLKRAPQAAAEVTLERLPQGYYKAVLRHGDIIIAADATTLPALWLDVWGRYFADKRTQPGPGLTEFSLAGFAGVDAVQDFLGQLSGWDEAVQEPRLLGLDMDAGGVSARFACRVVDAKAFQTRLDEALARLKLVRKPGESAPDTTGVTDATGANATGSTGAGENRP